MSILLGLAILFVTFIVVTRYWCFWSRSKVCLVGKTALVTGGASGLGYQTVLALAAKGCRVIIADIVNISEAVEAVIKETHNPNIIGKKVDLGSFKSVREFAKEIITTEEKLDILICNAGIGEMGFSKYTEDGLQKTMQVNYFSHFLLTHLLLDLLKKSASSRVVFTSSITAYVSSLTIENLNPKSEYFLKVKTLLTFGCYANSKLALSAAAKMFSKKLNGTGITINSVHPGGVKTSLYARGFLSEPNPIVILVGLFVLCYGKNSEEGAQTIIHLAQSDEVKDITGQSFFEGMRVPGPLQLNDAFCQKLWDSSIEYTKLEPHEIKC